MEKPIHIVMTPVRNEAWVLQAFLETTSLWADYIIIADQMSTDGSREMIKRYEERNNFLENRASIIMIDNTNYEFNEAERQSMLVSKAREISAGRDTLLWGLDADEILAANTFTTNDWQQILKSKPGDVFFFKWAEICPDQKEYWLSRSSYFPWLFHDDGKEPHGNYVRNIHSMRIPYPVEEKQLYYVDDFRVLHLAYLNHNRVASKRRFYQFVDWELNKRSPITLSMTYGQLSNSNDFVKPLTKEMLYNDSIYDFDFLKMIDKEATDSYMDRYIVDHLNRHLIVDTKKLDIWDDVFCANYKLTDPRSFIDRIIHSWLHLVVNHKENVFVRIINRTLRAVY